MQIEKDKAVSVHYSVREPKGEILEDSRGGFPLLYLHGHGGMIKELEEALEGKQAGDAFSISIDNAYGEREEGLVARVSAKKIMTEGDAKAKLKPGMRVFVETPEGPQAVTIVKVGLKTVDVDTNHPYSGMSLDFDIEVVDVRDATEDELSHGHAHGSGGFEH